MSRLKIGYSPCPNDTFIFAHLKQAGECGISLEPVLADVETLNEWAFEARLPVTKLSFYALGLNLDRYGLLSCGGALGRGCGPIVVARPGSSHEGLRSGLIAAPGQYTTARLLMALYLKEPPRFSQMVFSEVMPAVRRGEADYGLVIHEGRFTFEQYGLKMVLDLGQWWEQETGLPIPLGAIAVRRDLGEETARRLDCAIRHSLQRSAEGAPGTMEYVLQHAQEMDPDIVKRHIELYVNRFTFRLGEEGLKAVEVLFERAGDRGFLPRPRLQITAYDH